MSRRFTHLLLLTVAAIALPLLAMAETSDDDPSGAHEARPQGRAFFERFHDFRHFPIGRGRIGVQIQPMTPELRAFMGAPEDRGVLVERVVGESPAAKAGLRVGDVITDAGGEPIERTVELIRAVQSLDEGEALELRFVRAHESASLEVTPTPTDDHPKRRYEGPVHGAECERGECRHRGHRRDRIERRIDDIEKRLRELEETEAPDVATPDTST
jgi:membrane-associated protease RseP (regulator of RpoE activity)